MLVCPDLLFDMRIKVKAKIMGTKKKKSVSMFIFRRIKMQLKATDEVYTWQHDWILKTWP